MELNSRKHLSDFRGDDSGVLIIFALFMLVLMLWMAGMAVDVMRFETSRTKLQNTLDRAVLAAADLNQTMNPVDVVKDYFAKAGMTPFVGTINVQEDSANKSWRTVSVQTNVKSPSLFMNMLGINYLTAPGRGTAEERIGDVEISLILDNSGSMGSNNRLTNLKPAAKTFIDTMFDTVEDGRLSLSLIPYATQVTAGSSLLSFFNVTAEHNYSHCLEFATADYGTRGISLTTQQKRAGHIEARNQYDNPPANARECSTNANREIVAFSANKTALKTKIDAMFADGYTSIELGMKWGVALLDPAARPIVTGMIATGKAPGALLGRPADYTDDEAIKIVVIMSDGENTTQYKLRTGFESGLSNTWVNTSDGNYSELNATSGQYYIKHLNKMRTTPWGDGFEQSCTTNSKGKKTCVDVADPGDALRLTFPQLWNDMSILYHSEQIVRPGLGSSLGNYWRDQPRVYVDNNTKDSQLASICTAAKAQGIIVYTIGFEAPAAGQTALKNCATGPGYFYDVNGLEISTAFSSIASSINQLRLTQ